MAKGKRKWTEEGNEKPKQHTPIWIDPTYEQHVTDLGNRVKGHVTDDEVRSEPPDMNNHKRDRYPLVLPKATEEPIRLSGDDVNMPTVQAIPVYQSPPSSKSGHVRHVEDPLTTGWSILLMASVYFALTGIGVAGLLFLAAIEGWYTGEFREQFGLWIVLTVLGGFVALYFNQKLGLYHTATGIAHHETDKTTDLEMHRINKQAEVLNHSIDKHVELMEKKWLIEQQMNQKRLPGE